MSIEIVTDSTSEPITLVEAKDYCRITDSDSDSLIDSLITLARQRVELATNRKLLTSTLKLTLDKFPYWIIPLPGGTVQSISSFTYLDKNKDSQTLSATIYDEQLNKEPAILLRKAGYSWPSLYENGNAVVITYNVGWATKEEIPKGLILAIKSLVLFYYNNRELNERNTLSLPSEFDRLVFSHRVYEAGND